MKFTVYSKDGCPFCDKIKTVLNILNEKKIYSIVHYELDVDFTKDQFYLEFGDGSTFPQVVLDGKNIGGCVDSIKYLQNNGIL